MAQTPRTDREMAARTFSERPEVWSPASSLPDPSPNAEYDYRWVRISSYGVSDPRNASMRSAEGWAGVSPSDCPEVAVHMPFDSTTGFIDMGGHRLCRMTKRRAALGRQYYQEITDNQSRAVKANIQNAGPAGDIPLKNAVQDTSVRGRVPFGNGE